LIKSMRGSDPDAALYWLARMLEGGEDPVFVARRMVIFASEDVGNADSRALPLAVATLDGCARIGMPEARILLGQCATFLATAPKSNAAYKGIDAALEEVRRSGALPVPLHLRNAPTALARTLGHGEGYRYPHDHPDHIVAQQYLPDALVGRTFYTPTTQGGEKLIGERMAWWATRLRSR
jgi:putative ATPase